MTSRKCVGCDQPFTPGRRGGFLCDCCKKEIQQEAAHIKNDPLRRFERYVKNKTR